MVAVEAEDLTTFSESLTPRVERRGGGSTLDRGVGLLDEHAGVSQLSCGYSS